MNLSDVVKDWANGYRVPAGNFWLWDNGRRVSAGSFWLCPNCISEFYLGDTEAQSPVPFDGVMIDEWECRYDVAAECDDCGQSLV